MGTRPQKRYRRYKKREGSFEKGALTPYYQGMTRYQLFHRIADKDSAAVRLALSQSKLLLDFGVQFRNVETGPEALADLLRHTGKDQVPVLWDSEKSQIYSGKSAIFELLGSK